MEYRLMTPFDDETLRALRIGDTVYLSGAVYTGRDAAHKRMAELLDRGGAPPFPYDGQVIFYAGPCPAPPGRAIGSIGPTTSGRMDAYSPALIAAGLRVMIGKGFRSPAVVGAIREHGGVYFAAVGGAAALMSKCVTAAEVVAFPELGTEAIRRLMVVNLPLIVATDCQGRDLYSIAAQGNKP